MKQLEQHVETLIRWSSTNKKICDDNNVIANSDCATNDNDDARVTCGYSDNNPILMIYCSTGGTTGAAMMPLRPERTRQAAKNHRWAKGPTEGQDVSGNPLQEHNKESRCMTSKPVQKNDLKARIY